MRFDQTLVFAPFCYLAKVLLHRIAFLFELLHHRSHIDGIPDDDRIGDEIEATGLMCEFLTVLSPELSLVRDHQEGAQVV